MRLKVISLLGMFALTATIMFAHGDKKHVMGTLEKINADSVVVKQADGKEVEVKLVANTMYVTRDGKAAKVSDLAVGVCRDSRHTERRDPVCRRNKILRSGCGGNCEVASASAFVRRACLFVVVRQLFHS